MVAAKWRKFMDFKTFSGAAALALLSSPALASAADCNGLKAEGAHPGAITISEAEVVAADDKIPVEHCLVRGLTGSRTGADGKDYAIRFELRLPADWNGRFVHQFNGGNDGEVKPAVGPLLSGNKQDTALSRGYAVVSSDAGHDGKAHSERGLAGGAAFGFDPEARLNYGYQAVATLNPLAVQLVESYYGKPVAFSYGVGGSNGGRHGMVAASRMPEAFDGLLVGYPGFNLPKAAIQHALDVQSWASVNEDIAKAFSPDDMALVAQGILKACDGLDGIEDGIVADQDKCEAVFKLEDLQCKAGASEGCLSERQTAALQASHDGPKNSKGEQLYSPWGWDPGMGGGNWRFWKLESTVPPWGNKPIIDVMGAGSLAQIFTTPPTKVGGSPEELEAFLLGFDFDKDAPKVFATSGEFDQSAMEFMTPPGSDNPKLEAFNKAGHKMLVFHGNADPVFSVLDTVNWYKKLDANNGGKASEFVRLYRIPGMTHGAGGPSYDDYDFFSKLVAWVEKGEAPEAVPAGVTEGNKEGEALRGTRFLYCPHPQVTTYKGGEGTGENRFVCK